jgi:hypothetical protein
MKCLDALEVMPEVAGGELSGERADAVIAHARECAECGRVLDELRATASLTRRAGVETPPEGFSLELHKALVAAGPPPRSAWTRLRDALALRPFALAGASAALAAVLAIFGTLALSHRQQPVETASLPPAARVPETKVALVKIDFVAEHDVDDVDFEITLPDGLRFFSKGAQLAERSFRWKDSLKKGSNPIPIAVKGPKAGRYRVIAHAIGPDLDVTHEVWLEVTS